MIGLSDDVQIRKEQECTINSRMNKVWAENLIQRYGYESAVAQTEELIKKYPNNKEWPAVLTFIKLINTPRQPKQEQAVYRPQTQSTLDEVKS